MILLLAAAAIVAMPPAVPALMPGDAFVYSDGHVEQVRARKGGEIEWGGLSKRSYVRPVNPVLPITAWTSGRGEGRRSIIGTPDDLWPIGNRRSTHFRVVTEVRQRNSENWIRDVEHWTCRVGGTGMVQVQAGSFQATHISCDRHSPTTMRLLERHEWEYAPELGHHVRRSWIDYARASRRSIELVAALSGPAAQPERLRSLARAAGGGKSGKAGQPSTRKA
jgi:hypothetical protein